VTEQEMLQMNLEQQENIVLVAVHPLREKNRENFVVDINLVASDSMQNLPLVLASKTVVVVVVLAGKKVVVVVLADRTVVVQVVMMI